MAIPPGRRAGYALFTVGLLLVFDSHGFLPTNWLQIPISVDTESLLGYLAGFLGTLLLVPALVHILDNYAPDASMNAGQCLENHSVGWRLRQRFPLRKRFSALPNRGLVGLAILPLLVPAFLMNLEPESKGIYIKLTQQRGQGPDENCLAGPIKVTVKGDRTSTKLFVDGAEVSPAELERALRAKLASRANWEVFVEGDDSVELAGPVYVIDIIHSLHAHAVILTPKLKEQMAGECSPR
jgi:biopolymer transport protein ExbD